MDGLRGAARNLSSENEPWSARDQGFLLPASTWRDPPIFKPVLPGDIGLEKLSPIFRVSFLGCTTPALAVFAVFCSKISAKYRLSASDSLGFRSACVSENSEELGCSWLFLAVFERARPAADRKCMAAGDYQFDSEIASVIPI